MNCSLRLCALPLLLVIVGCSSKAPEETSVYLLRSAVEAIGHDDTDSQLRVGISDVTLAEYLTAEGVVLQLADHRIHHARYHLWAEPLQHSVKTVLAAELSAILGMSVQTRSPASSWDQRIDVYVDQLHGTSDGQIKVVAWWNVSNSSDGASLAGEIQLQVDLPGSGYDALVAAHRQVLAELAAKMASTVQQAMDAT
ncbi:MAG: PqiC family protein [Pseudomonadales bacterium]